MQNAEVSNSNDVRVVAFHNSTEFDFTPEMGCMYDGRPINGRSGAPGIQGGETVTLPYHVGNRLAINLAKRVFNTSPAATADPAGIPTGVPIWSESKLQELADTYLADLYVEAKPIAQSQTDILMAKVEEYKKMVDTLVANTNQGKSAESVVSEVAVPAVSTVVPPESTTAEPSKSYVDKQEVLAELEKRGIKHDKRSNKATLEKLLV